MKETYELDVRKNITPIGDGNPLCFLEIQNKD